MCVCAPRWLRRNGEAIYSSRRWRVTREEAPAGSSHAPQPNVSYTVASAKATRSLRAATAPVYAIVDAWPQGQLALRAPRARAGTTRVRVLGSPELGELAWSALGVEGADGMLIKVPAPRECASGAASGFYAFRLDGVE